MAGNRINRRDLVTGGALATGNGRKGFPLLLEKDQFRDGESFLGKELKYARRWLYSKGVTLPEEDRNPVEVQMESFFECCRTGDSPKADVEAGLANSTAVILSNLAMDEERRVYFNEIEKMGRREGPARREYDPAQAAGRGRPSRETSARRARSTSGG
jgi:hypothetical protein